MKKVYQTIVDKGHGNCMQAAIASLFELPLEKVPHFLELKEGWWDAMEEIYERHGYSNMKPFYKTEWTENVYLEALKYDGGVRGFFYGVVPSQTFPDVTHAVIVDKHLNIVHDPNPNQLAMKLRPEDVQYVYTCRPGWHIDYDNKALIIEEDDSPED